ncbi:MAG: N-acetylmuramoyl-L-alanine amidase, partial [Lachnospiraceae bacterium]
ANADIFLRIHADGAESTTANGISVLYPSAGNPYVAELSPESKKLAQSILDGMCDATGAKKRGIIERDDLTGTNWAKMPVIVVEAGFMTNEAEEKKLLSADYQKLLVQGILEGVREYFGE